MKRIPWLFAAAIVACIAAPGAAFADDSQNLLPSLGGDAAQAVDIASGAAGSADTPSELAGEGARHENAAGADEAERAGLPSGGPEGEGADTPDEPDAENVSEDAQPSADAATGPSEEAASASSGEEAREDALDAHAGTGSAQAAAVAAAAASAKAGTIEPADVAALATDEWKRLYGASALDTMRSIVAEGWKTSKAVVVVSANSYQDALSASALAGSLNAPILLTDPSSLSSQTKSEISRLKAIIAYIVGGSKAVSTQVEKQLKDMGLSSVVRIKGATAADTAAAVAEKIGAGRSTTFIVATSTGYQDVLSIAPYAYKYQVPIFLSSKEEIALSDTTRKAIASGGYTNAVIVGGVKAVPASVEEQILQAGISSIVRLRDATAEGTSVAIAQWVLGQGMVVANIGVATSGGYQDALAGAALCGLKNSPIVLIKDADRRVVYEIIDPNRSSITLGYIFGGRAVVTPETEFYIVNGTNVADKTEAVGYYLLDKNVYRISTGLAAKNKMPIYVKGAATSAGTNIQLNTADYKLAQYWIARYQGKGVYRFVSYLGGHYLGVAGKLVSGANVANVDPGNVDWKVSINSDGTYCFTPASAAKLHLAVSGSKATNGANVQLANASTAKNQRFWAVSSAPLTEAYALGKKVQPGFVEVALPSNSKLALEVASSSKANKGNIALASYSKKASQKFYLNYVGNGLYELQNVNSGKYLDITGPSSAAGTNIQQYTRHKATYQYWYLEPVNGGYRIKSAHSGMALDTKGSSAKAGANVQLASASNAATQTYTFTTVQAIENGTYVIQSALYAPFVLDAKGAGKANKTNIDIARSKGISAQKFKIVHVGNGQYTIENVNAGKMVELAGGSMANGANVQLYQSNGTSSQKWTVEVGESGLFFKSVKSGKYLNVASGKLQNGTNVQASNYNGAKAQAWVLHDSSWDYYSSSSSAVKKYIAKAEEYEGWRYKWGGRSPSTSFDCAGLVMYCANVTLGTSYDLMYTNASMLYSMCTPVSASQARPGDLVFYRGTYGSDVNYISHVVIYVGDGLMYGAGDPIGFSYVNSITNIKGNKAAVLYARIK